MFDHMLLCMDGIASDKPLISRTGEREDVSGGIEEYQWSLAIWRVSGEQMLNCQPVAADIKAISGDRALNIGAL